MKAIKSRQQEEEAMNEQKRKGFKVLSHSSTHYSPGFGLDPSKGSVTESAVTPANPPGVTHDSTLLWYMSTGRQNHGCGQAM
jgi:hypothetical protein